jgi:predicted CoA-binding protein
MNTAVENILKTAKTIAVAGLVAARAGGYYVPAYLQSRAASSR